MIKFDIPLEYALAYVTKFTKDARILDVGGGMKPLRRATHILDILPYNERSGHGEFADDYPVCYSEDTWLQSDMCVTPWPYADKYFDFVWCTQTVEDVRDPIAVVREMSRVGKAGYITTIRSNYELQFGVNSKEYAGYVHHRWLVDSAVYGLSFIFKYPLVHIKGRYTPKFHGYNELHCWWEDSIDAHEVILLSIQAIEEYFIKCKES